jgi:hypothetical protein|tara:strand:+ start:214 stop:375 length:162 start_codon:yes stop_codon:yes gene_type:complete
MKKIILKVLSEVGKGEINLQSESAQIMITDKLLEQLEPHVRDLIETIVVGRKK